MMLSLMLAAALIQVAGPEVQVLGPGKPNAQTPATMMVEPAAMFIVACDANGDGQTTRAELDTCLATSFAAADTGHAGQIGYIAYADWQKRWLGDQGALPSPFEIDRDGDNQITLAELQAQFERLFGRYDKDGDKGVTRAEALTIRVTAFDGRGSPRGPGRGKNAERPRGQRIPGGQPEGKDQP